MSKDEIKKIEMGKLAIWKDQAIWVSVIVLLIFLIASWVLWIYFYQKTTVPVGMPVYFSFLQSKPLIYKYVLPIFGSVIAFFHVIIALFAYNRDKLVSYLMIGGAAFLEILILTTVVYYMVYL